LPSRMAQYTQICPNDTMPCPPNPANNDFSVIYVKASVLTRWLGFIHNKEKIKRKQQPFFTGILPARRVSNHRTEGMRFAVPPLMQ